LAAGLRPDPLGELTALPQTPQLNIGEPLRGREGKGEWEGRGKRGRGRREGKGRDERGKEREGKGMGVKIAARTNQFT